MKRSFTHKLAAMMTVGAMSTFAFEAFAQGSNDGFKDMSNNIITSTSNFSGLINTVAYVGGTGLGVAGIFKLKQHVDNPGQVTMKDGLARLGGGGALLAFPFITQAMQGAIGDGAGTKLDTGTMQLEGTSGFVN